MAIRQLPIVGRPTDAPAPLRKIAIEEHFIDPTLVQPNYGDSFSGEFDQQGSSYAGFNPEFAEVVNARLHDLRDGRIEEMDAAGIDIAVISHTIGGVEGIPDPAVAVSTARRVNDFLAAEVAASGGRLAGFATVALQDVGAAVKELTRAVTELGFCGAMVNGYSNAGTDKLYLDEARFEPFWAAQRLQDYLSDNIWVTTSGNFNDQALITALLTVSADRIMFASDYPYDMSTDAARWIEAAPISENDRRKICYGNAAALFGLPR